MQIYAFLFGFIEWVRRFPALMRDCVLEESLQETVTGIREPDVRV
jgi:hypothetical protein